MKPREAIRTSTEPWNIEAAYYEVKLGIPEDKARTFVIWRWMQCGDLRPLAWAINNDWPLDLVIRNALVAMILDYPEVAPHFRIKVVPRKKGRPKDPSKTARDIVSLAYENLEGGSDQRFAEIAKWIGRSEDSVRKAWTAWQKEGKAEVVPIRGRRR